MREVEKSVKNADIVVKGPRKSGVKEKTKRRRRAPRKQTRAGARGTWSPCTEPQ